jgi:peptide/nickel transport system ATP-binding protein
MAILILVIGILIHIGHNYFQNESREIVREEFVNKFKSFYEALVQYLYQPPVMMGIAVVLLFYLFMSSILLYKYFNMTKPGIFLDMILNPQAIESIPHSLLVLLVYFAFLRHVDHLRVIMLGAFLVVSIPFIYKMIEDVFLTAQKEGIVENYLVLPISNWKILRSFWKRGFNKIFVIPVFFLIVMMVYWEFLYSSIGITGDEKSAPGVFYNNYNDGYLVNFPNHHNYLVLFQVGLFAAAIGILLYVVYSMRGQQKTGASTTAIKRKSRETAGQKPSKDHHNLVSCQNLTIVSLPDGKHQLNELPRDENKRNIVQNINLEIKKGENICIMGESGSGKTTLVREIAGIPPKGLQKENGTIHTHGNYIFTVFQDVDLYMDPYQTLYYYVKQAFKKRNRHNPPSAKTPAVDHRLLLQYIDEVGLLKPLLEELKQGRGWNAEKLNRALQQNRQQEIRRIAKLMIKALKTRTKQKLSGGEKQKFYLLIAFIANPEILVADEIFTDVDIASSGKISTLLFKKDFTVVFISHDIGMIKRLMDNRQLQKVYYLRDKEWRPQVWEYPHGKTVSDDLMPAWALDMWQAHQNIQSQKIEKITTSNDLPVVFEISSVTRQFDDNRRVTFIRENKPLTIRKGVNYALIGENGSGKTTLFKILTKLSRYKGKIGYWNGKLQELRKVPRYQCASQNQLVFQKTGNAIVEDLSIKEYLLSFFKKDQHPQYEQKIKELITDFFKKEKVQQVINSPFRALSVGEQRRILLIRSLLLVNKEGILFIDEAMRGMDVFLKERLVNYLKKKKLQILLISHDKHLVEALCEKKISLTFDKKTGKTFIRD